MNGLLVARRTLRESYRNRELPGILLLFALIFGGLGLFWAQVLSSTGQGTAGFLRFALLVTSLLVPMVGLVLGGKLVAGPREDGRLRLLLGQPISRRSFVLGRYAATAVVLVVGVLAGGLAMLGLASALGAPLDAALVGQFLALSIVVGLAYLGIAVSVSSLLRSTNWTTFAVFGIFLVFVAFWRLVPAGAVFVANGFAFPETDPAWIDLAEAISPSVAYEMVLTLQTNIGGIPSNPGSFTDPLLYVGLLALWILVVPALSIWRFTATDL